MSKSLISTGIVPNDGNGDTLLSGANKINSNFNEIYSTLGNGSDINVGVGKTVISTDALGNVGIGTVSSSERLTVQGNILASQQISGSLINASVGGVIPSLSGDNLNYNSANIVSGVLTSITGDNLNYNSANIVSGVLTSITGNNLNYSGIITGGSFSIGSTQVVSSGRELQNILSLDSVTKATIESTIQLAPNNFNDLNVTGISTLQSTSISNLTGTAATITSINGTNGSITNITGTAATITSINSTNGSIDSLSGGELLYTGISTFSSGPVLISHTGTATSTGTVSQPLQVTGGGYFSGSVGIGTISPQKTFVVSSSGEQGVEISPNDAGSNTNRILSYNRSTNANTDLTIESLSTQFQISGQEKVRIDSSGRLLVGISSASVFDSVIYPSLQVDRPSNNALNASILIKETELSTSWPRLIINKNRQNNVMQPDNKLGSVDFYGDTGSSDVPGADIRAVAESAWTSTSAPTRLEFRTTASGATSSTEQMRISQNGALRVPSAYTLTTGSAANCSVQSDGTFQRATSSIKYKTSVEDLDESYSDALLACRPVWYRSTSESDNPNHSYWGFIAEEVAEIDPRLVQWKTTEFTYDEETGSIITTPCDPEPEGVSYDRFVPHLLNLIKRQKEQIEMQNEIIAALESRVSALENK